MSKNAKATIHKGKIVSFIPTGEYYFKKGIKAYHRRDFLNAKKYLERALQLEPGEPMIACQLAIVSTELGEFEHSNRLLHLILEDLDHEMVECHYFLANNYAHLGFFKDAYHHAMLYLQADPDGDFSEDAEELLELLSFEAGELEDEFYQQDDLIVKQEQARDLLESGYLPKAIEILKEVIEEYPEYWSAYNNLALAYFYLGKPEKAEAILNEVLERNPGNLHALCNKMIFAHYQGRFKYVEQCMASLKKIQPLLSEHQFKLGTSFALVGEYELAYVWLKKLYKTGYDGDGPFYYWLSYSAFHTGHETFAKAIWNKLLELNPEKEGSEPWNDNQDQISGLENMSGSIFQKMESDYVEERLFALFLTTVSNKKEEIITSKKLFQNHKFTALEKEYISWIRSGKPSRTADAQEIAELFYENYQPIGTIEAGLYLMWFSVFAEASKAGVRLKNKRAWAGAVEYTWHKLRSEKVSQQEMAKRYDISTATIGKYVKLVQEFLR
ncbi:tetratricopeptide repeat protein [Neobacillus sp. OS1-32]|uniref:Tetratricopeptide repeat protein n=1 Tax=Neobacillus paridis TaxID=2803862 RepID=A0ABS1TWQ1_9BACI|nr:MULTISPECIES: tetratricopeptide repeat protein [Neobacillus]MBL4954988.1 tetratricopeptide repeat protein [Neobacillus paridis]WML30098.1 tetratricopeptide repeat protein [Neobacillus sp. OS1-32]